MGSGKEIHNRHPWSYAIESVLDHEGRNKITEKSLLIKIIDFRTKLKSLILLKDIQNHDEILKICENHIAGLIKNKVDVKPETFLNDNFINNLLNPRKNISSIYMSSAASNSELYTLESWVPTVIRNNTQTRFISK